MTVNPPHKGPVTRKMFPFHDVMRDASSEQSQSVVVGGLAPIWYHAIFNDPGLPVSALFVPRVYLTIA